MLLVGMLITFTSLCQNIEIGRIIDTLKSHPGQDSVRVNLLILWAKSPLITRVQRDSLCAAATAISEKINYPRGKVQAILVASKSLAMDQCIAEAEKATDFANASGDKYSIIIALTGLAKRYITFAQGPRGLPLLMRADSMAATVGDDSLHASIQLDISYYYTQTQPNYPVAMEWDLKALHLAEKLDNLFLKGYAWRQIGSLYAYMAEQEKAVYYLQKALDVGKKLHDNGNMSNILNSIGEGYRQLGYYPEALNAYREAIPYNNSAYNVELVQSNIADVYVRMDSLPKAFHYAYVSRRIADSISDSDGIAWIDGILGRAFLRQGRIDSAIWFGLEGYNRSRKSGGIEFARDNAEVLGRAYAAKKDFKNAYEYYKVYIIYRDSMLNSQLSNKANVMQYNYDLEKKQAEIAVLSKDRELQLYAVRRQRLLLLVTIIGLFLILGIMVLLIRNNRHRRRAYALLEKQKLEIQEQRDQTNQALSELQATQAQLVQSEKMASLGELTAGIAHEIQNPLNFVNNFSDVSVELIDELREGPLARIEGPAKEECEALLGDISQNLEKISYHGRRADAIVKGMLHHSRNNSQKELTDINALADEYMRLSYHGLRAKDKSFNAVTETSFAPGLPNIYVIPQDIGRVLLNLFTNAFYSVAEKKKRVGEGYQPTVTVTTSAATLKGRRFIEITVHDNGLGIPQRILDKIYQPFFTTKPTGQGTGLGLSMSYDIVTKSHQGEIKVDTREGEYASFIIQLPV